MDAKTTSIIAYITIFGWLIAYFQHKGNIQKSTLTSYHLNQGLGIFLFAVVLNVVLVVLVKVLPELATLFSLIGFLPLILIIFGIIAAANEATKPVPLIGRFFEGKFNF